MKRVREARFREGESNEVRGKRDKSRVRERLRMRLGKGLGGEIPSSKYRMSSKREVSRQNIIGQRADANSITCTA
jgi:hypothetical protein